MWKQRKRYRERLAYFKANVSDYFISVCMLLLECLIQVKSVIMIQSWWRAHVAKKQYKTLS